MMFHVLLIIIIYVIWTTKLQIKVFTDCKDDI